MSEHLHFQDYARYWRRQTAPEGEIIAWACRQCRRPSFLMYDAQNLDGYCRRCRVLIANGEPCAERFSEE